MMPHLTPPSHQKTLFFVSNILNKGGKSHDNIFMQVKFTYLCFYSLILFTTHRERTKHPGVTLELKKTLNQIDIFIIRFVGNYYNNYVEDKLHL